MSRLERFDVFQADEARSALRIVHVVRQFAPGVGGMEEFVHQLASRQVAAGHSVRVVTLDRIFGAEPGARLARVERIDGIEVARIPFIGSQRYPLAPGVLAHVRDGDVVHVHGVDFFADFLAATRLIHRKPMVLTTHGGFFHTGFANRLKKLYFATITRASLTQYGAVTACSAEDARTFGRILDDRLQLIRNPVDIDKFANCADPTARTMIYFGRLAGNKGIDRLIAWFAGFAAARPGWQLIVAGRPMGVSVDDLARVVAELGIGGIVEIHPSPSAHQLRALIGRSSAYACASSYEGFGLAAVEAASAGLCPVLSDIPPFADTIADVGFGCSVDFTDTASWPSSYARVDAELARFRSLSPSTAIRNALEPFAWSASIPRFEELYRNVLGESRRRIGPLRIDVTRGDTAQSRILAAAAVQAPLLVVFCNAHSVNVAANNPALQDAMGEALVLNDGVGVDLA
ncbi:MAG: glycosyltransferase, partial [Rhizorhabdus sp.]